MATNTNILFPQTPFIDPSTGRPSLPWVLWLQNPSFVSASYANALAISSGGTGISTAPTNGQLLIGNAGNYTLHTLTPSSGIGITNGAGLITVANTGVLSNIASSGISVSSATGNVTIANTGVLSAIAGSGISVSGATGNVTFANTGVLSFSGGSTGLTPATATTGAVSLAGTLAVAYGGTGQTTYTNGQLLIGNTTGNTLAKSTLTAGTGISITNGAGSITVTNTSPSSGGTVTSVSVVSANGLAGTVATSTTTPAITLSTTITGLLKGNGTAISAATSGTDYAPATSGTSILYGNGSGGFSNVTIGSGISFATGTLSATGSGGTVTSVAALTLGTTGTDLSSTVANGTTTPVITLNVPTASATNRGALSAADWTTFNNKGSGTVTSVTGTAPVVSSGGTTPAISMAAATTSVNGYLTSTDWTTFNGKQAALVSGTNIKTVNGTTLLGSGDVGTITYAYGGTGQTTVTTGDLLYGSAANTWSKLGIGTTGQILRVVSGAPAWGTDYVGTVTSVGGTGTVNGITLTGTVTSSGNLTLGGTLGSIANSQLSNSAVTIGSTSISLGATSTTLAGLTGVTSSAITDSGLTSGRVTYATTGGLLTDSANLTFNGSALAVTGTLSATADANLCKSSGNITAGFASSSGTLKLDIYDSTLTSTTIGANRVARIGSNVNGGDCTLQFTDSVAYNSYISAKANHIYIQPATTGTYVADFSSTGLAVTGTLSATGLTLDSTGTLGLGVTPIGSSAGAFTQLQIGGGSGKSTFYGQSNDYACGVISASYFNSSSQYVYASTSKAVSEIYLYNGDIIFRNAAAGTAGNTFTPTERTRISSAGIVTMSAYGAGAATFSASGVISSVSDETWKIKDGVPVDPDAMLNKLEPGYWYYNDDKKDIFGKDRQLGFYAQNVNAAIGPEAAPEPEENKPWGYYDRSVLAVTVMSLKKTLKTIESLTERITELEAK